MIRITCFFFSIFTGRVELCIIGRQSMFSRDLYCHDRTVAVAGNTYTTHQEGVAFWDHVEPAVDQHRALVILVMQDSCICMTIQSQVTPSLGPCVS